MPSHATTRPTTRPENVRAPQSGVEVSDETAQLLADASDSASDTLAHESSGHEHTEPTHAELLAAYADSLDALARAKYSTPQKPTDLYEPDDSVTLLLPAVYRAVVEGKQSTGHRDYIAAEQPGHVDEETGRAERSVAVTLTFLGGVCRDVPYAVARGLKKSRAYRSNDALKVVPSDTQEAAFARLCGVQPMLPQKQAAMLLNSDLDAVLSEFNTEQLKVFAAALARRVQNSQNGQAAPQAAPQTASGDILSSASFTRG